MSTEQQNSHPVVSMRPDGDIDYLSDFEPVRDGLDDELDSSTSGTTFYFSHGRRWSESFSGKDAVKAMTKGGNGPQAKRTNNTGKSGRSGGSDGTLVPVIDSPPVDPTVSAMSSGGVKIKWSGKQADGDPYPRVGRIKAHIGSTSDFNPGSATFVGWMDIDSVDGDVLRVADAPATGYVLLLAIDDERDELEANSRSNYVAY